MDTSATSSGENAPDTSSPEHAQASAQPDFLTLTQTEEETHTESHQNYTEDSQDLQSQSKNGNENDVLNSNPPDYGTIERGTAEVPHETTANELWQRHQQQPFFTADKFFSLIVFFALLAFMLIWLFDTFESGPTSTVSILVFVSLGLMVMVWMFAASTVETVERSAV